MSTKIQMIQTLQRLPNSKKGNPRYRVFFTDGEVAITKSDSEFVSTLGDADTVAPNLVEVRYERGLISGLSPLPAQVGKSA